MIGETIGHFKIVSRLGRGGMGEVYAGEHESIQTRVAIKILHAEISKDTEHVQRFFNEAKIVGRIKHAGIVKIFDVGFYQDHAYLIMELLEGEPLAARIDRAERLPWQDTAELARQIASVLDATHRAGVIHRDLKPDNIFLVPDHELASGERVKVLDFGISKLSGTMASGSPKTVGTMGTPQYMAPEQWGDSGQVDWRADAYSLGCVVFEMLSGGPPFEVKTIAEACAKHLSATPPTPSEVVPGVPASLDALILRLLAKNPAQRGASMGQIARELQAIATGEPVLATTTPSRSYPRPATPPPFGSPTATTLGASAAQIHVPPPKRRAALIGGIAAGVVVFGVLVAVMMTRTHDAPASEPNAQPAATATATPSPTATATPTPTPTPTATPTPDAAPTPDSAPTPDAAPTPANPPPIVHSKPPRHPPIEKPPVVKPPVTKPPEPPPDDMGGRL